MMIPITHVIFDLDGTLIDSEKHLFQSTNDVLNEFGKTFDWNIRSKTLGLHLQKSAPIIIKHFNLPIEPIDYIDKVLLRFKSYVQGDNGGYGIQLLPGVKRLVTHLSRHNIPMAICTGCKEDTFRYKTQPFGDFFCSGNLFHHFVIAGSDPEIGEQNKPNPLPYLICIERFNENGHRINPKQVLAFEDSPTGLQSAIDAGCQTIFIPDPKLDLNSLPVQPSIILKSMEHFQPEKFGLPPFSMNE